MKNITVTLDDETYRKARVRAAELDTSVSAIVRKYLTEFAEGESRFERLKKQEEAVRARIEKFTAEDRLSRDELHDRKL
jgi:plasmid stability protein